MTGTIRVRRAGPRPAGMKVTTFRRWLLSQPRKELTYGAVFGKKAAMSVERPTEIGWTTQDFVLESMARGTPMAWGTVLSWATGSQPNAITLAKVRQSFPKIEF